MSEQQAENIKDFFSRYKTGEIIYPNAIARYFQISLKRAYEICEELKMSGLVKIMYMICCPVCGKTINQRRHYSLTDIDTESEIGCEACGHIFIPNVTTHVSVLYEKM